MFTTVDRNTIPSNRVHVRGYYKKSTQGKAVYVSPHYRSLNRQQDYGVPKTQFKRKLLVNIASYA